MKTENIDKMDFKRRMQFLFGAGIITVIVFFVFKYCFGFLWPLVFSWGFAYVLEKPIDVINEKIGHRSMLAATIIIIMVVIMLSGIIALIGYYLVTEIRNVCDNYERLLSELVSCCSNMCREIDKTFRLKEGSSYKVLCSCQNKIVGFITDNNLGQTQIIAIKSVSSVIKGVAFFLIELFVMIFGTIYAYANLNNYRRWRKEGLFGKEAGLVVSSIRELINVYFKYQMLIMIINIAICIVGFLMIKNRYAIVLGIVIGIIDVLPMLGTGTVLVPWAIICLLFHDYRKALILLTLYGATYLVRQIIESKCTGEKVGISPFMMLSVIYLGLVFYGVMGFILGPVSYCVIKALVLYLKSILENDKLNGH